MRKMRLEHDHQVHLAELEALTHSFTPPANACGSWRALYQGCEKLSQDLRRHIAIENDVLFPLFEATSGSLRRQSATHSLMMIKRQLGQGG